jgi:hypothetical protein
MAAAAGGVVLLGVLLVFVKWYAALGIAAGLAVFLDASLAGITRIAPSSNPSGLAPMVWGLVAFVPVLGVGAYALVRSRLADASAEDAAPADMDPDEMEETGKIAKPSPLSPTLVLLLPLAVVGGYMFPRAASLELVGGKVTETGRVIPSERAYFNQGDVGFRLRAGSPLTEYGALTYTVVKLEGEKEIPTGKAGPVEPLSTQPKYAQWSVEMTEDGIFRLDVTDEDGGRVASLDFKVRPQ